MSLTFLHTADVHFGRENDEAIAAFAQYAEDAKADAIVVAGDITQRGTIAEFKQAAEWLESLPCPLIVVPGNHDTPLLNVKARVRHPFRRYYSYAGDYSKDIRTSDFRIVGMNTARGWQLRKNWAEGSVDLDLLRTITQPQDESADFSAVVVHHPFEQPEDAQLPIRTSRGEAASSLMAASSSEVLFAGHVHEPTAQEILRPTGRYLALTCGTLSSRLRRAAPSFNVVKVGPEDISVQTMNLEEGGLTSVSLGSFARPSLAVSS